MRAQSNKIFYAQSTADIQFSLSTQPFSFLYFLFETRHVYVCARGAHELEMNVCVTYQLSLFPYTARLIGWLYLLLLHFILFVCFIVHSTSTAYNKSMERCFSIKPLAVALDELSWINNVRRNGCKYISRVCHFLASQFWVETHTDISYAKNQRKKFEVLDFYVVQCRSGFFF